MHTYVCMCDAKVSKDRIIYAYYSYNNGNYIRIYVLYIVAHMQTYNTILYII